MIMFSRRHYIAIAVAVGAGVAGLAGVRADAGVAAAEDGAESTGTEGSACGAAAIKRVPHVSHLVCALQKMLRHTGQT